MCSPAPGRDPLHPRIAEARSKSWLPRPRTVPLLRRALVIDRERDVNVRVAPLDRIRRAPGARLNPLHDRTAVDARLRHIKLIFVEAQPALFLEMLRITDGAGQHLLQQAGALVRQKLQ